MLEKIVRRIAPRLYEKAANRFRHLRGSGIKTLGGNIASLSVLQATNYVLPLITLPYLVRVLGADRFGLVAFAQAVIQYFVILTDYGFTLSATKQIAADRNDMARVSQIFSSVYVIKLTIMTVAFGILWILTLTINRLAEHQMLFLLTYGAVLGNVLFPVWFYQGIEKMQYSTAINLLGRILYIVLIFSFIHHRDDYLLIPVFNSLGLITTGIICLWFAVRKFGVVFRIPPWKILITELKQGFQFFLSRVSVSMYTSLNTLVLGFVATDQVVGYYAAAEKLFIAMRSAFYPLVTALYPYMANRRQIGIFKKIFYPAVGGSIVTAGVISFFSKTVTELIFGAEFAPSAPILQLFSLIIPVVAASIMLGYPFLAALGREKYANFSVAIGSVGHLLLIVLLIPVITMHRIVLVTMLTEAVILAVRIYGVRKYHLWRTT